MFNNDGKSAAVLVILVVLSLVVLLLSSTGKLLRKPPLSLSAAADASIINLTASASTTVGGTTATATAAAATATAATATAAAATAATAATATATTAAPAPDSTTFKVEMRFPPTLVGKEAGKEQIIDLKSEKGIYDAGFVCQTFNVYDLLGPVHSMHDSHLVKIEPIVTEIQQYGSIVHHMDIFTCQETVGGETKLLRTRSKQSEWCASDHFLETKSCTQLIWAYDRGAHTFDFPKEAAILFGPSSGFTSVVLQIHYLLPAEYFLDGRRLKQDRPGMIDSSGFELTFDTTLRDNDSSLFGFLDFSMEIPPHTANYVFQNHVDSYTLAKMIAPDLIQYGKVTPFAVHLHAHNHATSVKLEHYRNGIMLKVYDQIPVFHGYGVDQTFRHLKLMDVEPIYPGDSLTFVCTFSNVNKQEADYPIHYGVSHGDEMCAPLVLYYPHVRGARGQTNVNLATYAVQKRPADVNSEAVMHHLLQDTLKFEHHA